MRLRIDHSILWSTPLLKSQSNLFSCRAVTAFKIVVIQKVFSSYWSMFACTQELRGLCRWILRSSHVALCLVVSYRRTTSIA